VRLVENAAGERGCEIWVGGGLGRTPFVALVCRDFVPKEHLLSYLEAILRVYNRFGRRDNKYKARIKILVNDLGIEKFQALVDAEWELIKDGVLKLTEEEIARVSAAFAPPKYTKLEDSDRSLLAQQLGKDRNYAHWLSNNVEPHKQAGYNIVVLSLKHKDSPPGDVSDTQLDCVADLADRFSLGRVVATHGQNLVLPDVESNTLPELYEALLALDMATPNSERLTDIICCPGLDFCALANARSIPVAQELMERFDDVDYLNDLGEISVKISGCINACGHHHIGNIGILGIDKSGVEHYQLLLGGAPGNDAAIGHIMGPAFTREEIVGAVDKVLSTYLAVRKSSDERFLDTYRRVGETPFKEALYGNN
jgi:sulfite reductase (NADPH) hemoprotein beta-component